MDDDLHCSRHGTFFLCEGLTGSVLEVRAKKYRSEDIHPFPVLTDGLKKRFENVAVQWVLCPDLTQEPYNLAAPGLCGQPSFIEIGGKAFLNNSIKRSKFFIPDIMASLGEDSFMFGSGVHARANYLDQLILNASWSCFETIKNKNYAVYAQKGDKNRCDLTKLKYDELNCTKLGTFFLCNGLRGPVLRVQAKAYRAVIENPWLVFIDSMRDSLKEGWTCLDNPFVVLGGVYLASVPNWAHLPVPYSWEPQFHVKKRYCSINQPDTIISIFNNSETGILKHTEFPPMKLTCKSYQSLSHHHEVDTVPICLFPEYRKNDIDYLGYFCPAETVYHFDDPLLEFPHCSYCN